MVTRAERTGDAASHVLRINRRFAAPRDLVFRQWTEAQHVAGWFAPDHFETTSCDVDARVGGAWHITYASARGEVHHESGEFLEVVRPERLVFTLTQRDGRGNTGADTVVTVVLVEDQGGTVMQFEQVGYRSEATRDRNAMGWKECLDKLERRLA